MLGHAVGIDEVPLRPELGEHASIPTLDVFGLLMGSAEKFRVVSKDAEEPRGVQRSPEESRGVQRLSLIHISEPTRLALI
eukprot:15055703-Alexandrium_andersonii.AAC.1